MKNRSRFVALCVLPLIGLLFTALSSGQTCVRYPANQGCQPNLQPQQCFPVASGPDFWQDIGGARTWQYRRAIQSVNEVSCEGTLGSSIPNCCSGLPPSGGPGPTIALRLAGTRILVDYDAPGLYCTNVGDWPPSYTCANDPEAVFDRVSLYDSVGNPIRRSFIYFENGTWDTGVDIASCGQAASYQASIRYLNNDTFNPFILYTAVTPLTATCADREECGGPAGSTGNMSVGLPINVGSGDVTVKQKLFTIAQEPMSLPFTLTYHSSAAIFPALITEPVGKGWTHEYAQTLRREDGSSNRLYHVTAQGYEHEYLRIAPASIWTAINPGELRGTVQLVGSEYRLTDLHGTVTTFDAPTGRWVSTTDRWGNSITGTYTGNDLTTVTDTVGRQVALGYTAGKLTNVTADGNVWRLAYTADRLTSLFDPLHTGPTAWKTFQYVNDSHGVQRLLSEVRDDAGKLLEGHSYDAQDRGTTSVSEAGRESVTIQYDFPTVGQRRATHQIDGTSNEVSDFTVVYQSGRWLSTLTEGVCATCGGGGGDRETFMYDPSNHVTQRVVGKDLTGTGGADERVQTNLTYDANGMVLTRVEAVGKPETRTTSYTYNYASGTPSGGPPWPGFVTSIAETSVAKPLDAPKTTTFSWNATGIPERTLTTAVSGYLLGTDPQQTVYTTTTIFGVTHRTLEIDGPDQSGQAPSNRRVTYSYGKDTAGANHRGRLVNSLLYTSVATSLITQYNDYDIFGTARKMYDANVVSTSRTRDAKGRVLTVTSISSDPNEPPSYTTRYDFDLRDRLTDLTLPRGNRLHYVYEDGTNRLTDTVRVDSSGLEQERLHLTLNTIGGKTQEEAQKCNTPASFCTGWTTKRSDSFAYDTHNRLSSIIHPDSSHTDYAYDSRGNLKTVRDENHAVPNTSYVYDGLNRMTSVTQTLTGAAGRGAPCPSPAGQIVTCHAYDTQDNLASVTDPKGNATSYAYDDFGRMQKQTSPVSMVTTYSYDAAGNLTSSTDANTAITTRTYDAANRILTSFSTRAGFSAETTTWAYDDATAGAYGMGRLASMIDQLAATTSVSTAYAYERRGLMRSESRIIQGDSYSLSYGYDANGNRKRITYPSGRVVDYTFDFADRAVSANSGATSYVDSATYEPFGPQADLKFGNGTTKTTTYDNRYRPTGNKLVKDSSQMKIADYVLAPDPLGNITAITDLTNAAYDRNFVYDDLNRLTTANSGGSLWGTGTNGYAYDAMGNMTSLTLGASRTATFFYSGTTPKLASVTENGTPRSVSYDSAGNEATVGSTTYTYSPRNLLISGDAPTYAYDGRGLRIVTNADTSGPSITSFSPPSGLVGTSVTINGTNFTGATSVKFNGTTASFTVNTAIQITATVPAGATTGTISVTTPGGTATSAGTFTVTTTATPTITSFSPPSGLVGTSVTINGTNFTGATSVKFNGTTATFTVNTAIQITATVPAGATTGTISVTTPGGTATSAGTFTVGPWITIFSPSSGPVGTVVTITGANFTGATTVKFKNKSASFTVNSPTQITATVPSGAMSGTISVITSAGTGTSSTNFTVAFLGPMDPNGVRYASRMSDVLPIERVASLSFAGQVGLARFATGLGGDFLGSPIDLAFDGGGGPSSPSGWEKDSSGDPSPFASIRPAAVTALGRRYFFYTPEMSLMAETELTSNPGAPTGLYEYIWFNGQPVAQVDVGSVTHWTFTDHLGTPLIQTDTAGTIYWRAEHEPYGKVFALRTADQHQPLRLPGQEAEQLNLGPNGATERSYNIFRWYRSGWGRYTQPDPIGLKGGTNLFAYVDDRPTFFIDPFGLCCTNVDRTRELVLALGIAAQTQERNFFVQLCTGRLFRGNAGCGYNADGMVVALGDRLKCWKPTRVDAGPRMLFPDAFQYSRVFPHSFVRLDPVDVCECPTPTSIALDNYFGWPTLAPFVGGRRSPL